MSFPFRVLGILLLIGLPAAQAQVPPAAFVNFEVAPVHAIDLSPDGNYLASVNTPDMRVEIYSFSQGIPSPLTSIPVGLEPVSVRFRTNSELWVVNNLSDSVSVVDVEEGRVVATLTTLNDPYDVVFAGSPERAFVSCSLPRALQVFNPSNLAAAPVVVPLQGNSPRAMAVSPDGSTVHVAFFHSGNRTTILSGGMSDPGSGIINYPPDAVRRVNGPHGGVNPPPNAGTLFNPPQNLAAGTPPKVSLIVRQDSQGIWRDDTGADWTNIVSGANADYSGRFTGWTLLDHDVAVVDASTLQVNYISDLMNLCMAIDVNPASGQVTVVGTEAHNEIRFEPIVNATFIDVVAAFANPGTLQAESHTDLNASLVAQFSGAQLPLSERSKAIGDPRSIKWMAGGDVGFIAGMGSNNIIVIDSTGQQIANPIPVQEGPVGLAVDEDRDQLYVLNRFNGSISVIDLEMVEETAVVHYFDPTPTVIRTGRKHLYDTHHSSAIGQIACASCHVDGRMDRLSWDLGNPAGNKVLLSSRDLNRSTNSPIPLSPFGPTQAIGTGSLTDFHPMKGPMLTQTLQDIIDHEPLHWRGDRFGIEEFNDAFHELQGRGAVLTTSEMAEFKAFLATIVFPPNPFRNLNNTLPTSLNLSGHFTTGRFGAAGQPLPPGNAVTALAQYRNQNIGSRLDQGVFACVTCHTLPTGGSTDRRWVPSGGTSGSWQPIARGPNNENHLMVMGVSDVPGPIQNTVKVPQMRNLLERVGFNMRPGTVSLAGFGYMHDGNVPSIADFIANPAFNFNSDQQIANMVALLLSWSGSDFGVNNNGNVALEPPGVFSRDSHAAVGQQETITTPGQSLTRLNSLVSVSNASARISLIAKAYGPDGVRGYLLSSGTTFLADFPGEQVSQAQLVAATGDGNTVTFTVVPSSTATRMGLDRDMDGYLDYEERLNCTDPNDPSSFGEGGCAGVVESYVYHNSWTGVGSAVDSGKTVHKEGDSGEELSFDNLINSAAGINGVGFDIDNLANPSELTAADFVFQMSPQGAFPEGANPPESWESAPAPLSVSVTEGSPDQVLILWDDHEIENRWLRITIKANTNTGLPDDEVYYIGHMLGATSDASGGVYTVAFTDILTIRNDVGNSVDASSTSDIDKNGVVAFADIGEMRANVGAQLTNISVPATP